jgi:hypothetical protein
MAIGQMKALVFFEQVASASTKPGPELARTSSYK